MPNMKDILSATRNERNMKKATERNKEYNSPGRVRDRANAEKARKLNSFASAVLNTFANETGSVVFHRGTDGEMYRNCLAVYAFYRRVKSFLSVKLHPMFEVVIGTPGSSTDMGGYTAGHVLVVGRTVLGDSVALDEITETWFAKALAAGYLDWEEYYRWTGR